MRAVLRFTAAVRTASWTTLSCVKSRAPSLDILDAGKIVSLISANLVSDQVTEVSQRGAINRHLGTVGAENRFRFLELEEQNLGNRVRCLNHPPDQRHEHVTPRILPNHPAP